MVTALELLDELEKLLRELPLYVNTADWEKAKVYYYQRIAWMRKQIELATEEVEEIERRVSLVQADIVKLENA